MVNRLWEIGKKPTFYFIVLFSFQISPFQVSAQCDKTLVDKAFDNLKENQVFIREFKIRLDKSSPKKPEPVAKYNLYMQEGIVYRISIENADQNESATIVQLYKNEELVLSNFNSNQNYISNEVEYTPGHSGKYILYFSFLEGRPGCAVAILSMNIEEMEVVEEQGKKNMEIIYQDKETPLSIQTDANPDYEIEHEISKGVIFKRNGEYIVQVHDTGIVELKTRILTKEGKPVEEAITYFKVEKVPNPKASFHGLSGGLINKNEIGFNDYLEIYNTANNNMERYRIVEFKLGLELNDFKSYKSYNENLTTQQYNLLRSLSEGDKFYIYDIIIQGPENIEYKTGSLGFIIME